MGVDAGEKPAHAPAGGVRASYLDINPSNGACGASTVELPARWSEQQFKIRRLFSDRLNYWQSHGYEVHWVTLSSAYGPQRRPIRDDFAELRRRVAKYTGLGLPEYVCVETSEGNGVLHLCWSVKTGKAREFFVSYAWLSEQWASIRGAWSVSISRVKASKGDRRRLTRYVVCQYAGGQSGLVRASQSRVGVPLAKMRAALLRSMRSCVERYDAMKACAILHAKEENIDWGRLMGQWFFMSLRRAWDDLISTGGCWYFEREFVWFNGELCEV